MASWLIPCSPGVYDAEAALREYGRVSWHQQCSMQPGDLAYLYVTSPVMAIRCKCVIEETDVPFDDGEDDDGYVLDEAFCARTYRRYMDLRLAERYEDSPMLGYRMLLMNGLTGAVRSQRRVPATLEAYLEDVTPQLRLPPEE